MAQPSASISLAGALALAFLACGGDDEQFTDGGPIDGPTEEDATVDAPIDATALGTATLTVRGMGNPVPGLTVVWNDPTGAVQTQEVTDNAGVASETIMIGSSVTLFVTMPGGGITGYITISFLAIEPGDNLVWDFDEPTSATATTATITLPGAQATATSYTVSAGCTEVQTATPTQPVTLVIPMRCLGSNQSFDIVAVANDTNGAPVGYDHANTTVTGAATAVTLDAWQTTYQPLTYSLTNPPADATGVGVENHFRIDGVHFDGPRAGGGFAGGSATIASGYWNGSVVNRLQYAIFIGRTAGNPAAAAGASILLGGKPDAPATVAHDLSTLLPIITAATLGETAGRLQVDWTPAGSFATTDGALMLTNWTETGENHQAFVMAPPDVSSPLTMPVIPDALMAYRPGTTPTFLIPTIIFAEADYLAGYDVFRREGWRIFGDNATNSLPPAGGLLRGTLGGQLPGGGGN